MNTEHNHKINILSIVILGIQAVFEGILLQKITVLDILPMRHYIGLIGILGAALILSFVLLFVKQNQKKNWIIFRKIVAAVLCVVMVIAGFKSIDFSDRLNSSLEEISVNANSGILIGIYVLADNEAETLEDAADLTFAYGKDFNEADILEAIDKINEQTNKNIKAEAYDTTLECINDLYEGSCDALIMNEAYADILEDIEADELIIDYSDFSEKTKLIGEISLDDESTEVVQSITSDIINTPFIVYLSGSDTRSELLATSRSDVNILAVVNPLNHQILLVNTPRDYFIANPESADGAKDKLTHCGIYGIDCSIKALSTLYGVDVNYYAQINFTGFSKLVDAVGGLTIYSDVAFSGGNGGVTIQEGENTLNGEEVLGFVRERYMLSGGDNDRGKNQMKVIQALIRKITSSTTIITNYKEILDSLNGMIATNLTMDDLSSLVKMQLDNDNGWEVYTYAVTGTGSMDYTYSMPGTQLYVMNPDQSTVNHASELMQRMLNGEMITETDIAY